MSKASEAFRTISEVADDLEVPKHVLRFWEVKFPQIRPMKRGGGRRYYRPEDLELLRGIRQLLHAEGYTIKGVQKILREQGVDHVKRYGRVDAAVEKPQAAVKRVRAPDAVAETTRIAARAAPGSVSASTSAPVQAALASTPAGASLLPRKQRDAIKAAIAELEACRLLLAGDGAAVAAVARGARAARS